MFLVRSSVSGSNELEIELKNRNTLISEVDKLQYQICKEKNFSKRNKKAARNKAIKSKVKLA